MSSVLTKFRWGLVSKVFADKFLHPDHIIPSVEFITAFIEFSYQAVTHVSVEFYAVFIQVFIFCGGISDAGIHVQDSLFLKSLFKGVMKFTADPHMF